MFVESGICECSEADTLYEVQQIMCVAHDLQNAWHMRFWYISLSLVRHLFWFRLSLCSDINIQSETA